MTDSKSTVKALGAFLVAVGLTALGCNNTNTMSPTRLEPVASQMSTNASGADNSGGDGGNTVNNDNSPDNDSGVDNTGNDDNSPDNDGGTTGGGSSPFEGSFSGNWNGTCEGFNVRGTFSMAVSSNGRVRGSFKGDDSGSISGNVTNSGSLSAAGGSAGECTWKGQIKQSGNSLNGNGTWSCGSGCSGTWSGS